MGEVLQIAGRWTRMAKHYPPWWLWVWSLDVASWELQCISQRAGRLNMWNTEEALEVSFTRPILP